MSGSLLGVLVVGEDELLRHMKKGYINKSNNTKPR